MQPPPYPGAQQNAPPQHMQFQQGPPPPPPPPPPPFGAATQQQPTVVIQQGPPGGQQPFVMQPGGMPPPQMMPQQPPQQVFIQPNGSGSHNPMPGPPQQGGGGQGPVFVIQPNQGSPQHQAQAGGSLAIPFQPPQAFTPPGVPHVPFQPSGPFQPPQVFAPPQPQLIVTGSPGHSSPGNSLTCAPFMVPGPGGIAMPLMMSGSMGRSPGHSMNASGTSRGSASTSSRTPMNPKVWGYAIVDPLHPSLQRIPVPPSAVHNTAGVEQYNSDVAASSVKPCSSAVCMKYANSKDNSCPLGETCTNFHIAKEYLDRCRALSGPICCMLSDDCFGQEMVTAGTVPQLTTGRYILVLEDKSEIEIVPGQLAITVGLEHLYVRANDVRVINLKKQVCRMHLEGKCKWTKDCGHVHICRDLVRYLGIFHYPSLHFLLMTDNDSQIQEKLQAPDLVKFLSSHSARPLLEALVTAEKSKAIAVLEAAGVVMPPMPEKVAAEVPGKKDEGEAKQFSTFAQDGDAVVSPRAVQRPPGGGNSQGSDPSQGNGSISGPGGVLSGILNASTSSATGLTPMMPLANEDGRESETSEAA